MSVSISSREGQTDLANARRFIQSHGDNVRFCFPWGKWYVYDGARWKPDDDGAVMRLAKATADSVWNEARKVEDAGALKHAVRTASDAGARAMLSLAASDVPILPSDLDPHPWLLNCINGTVDLRTGQLRPHRREDSITKLCPTEFDPDAPSWMWDRFQEDVAGGDDSLVRFKQRWYGYCATADVREQILTIYYGSGSNGKSTELEAIIGTLGEDFAGAAPKDFLIARKGDSHPTEIADLFGKRLIVASETEANRSLAESLVKQLTGGDTLKARRMREDFWTFQPTHKLILLTNHKPKVKGTDHAIWRRLRLVPFIVRFDGDRKDKSMRQKLEAERRGILAWIVRGAAEWAAGGLTEPEAVTAATAEYRSDSDIIGRFISDCCWLGADMRVKFSELHGALDRWCIDGGDTTPSKRTTTLYLADQLVTRFTNNGLWYAGIQLRTE